MQSVSSSSVIICGIVRNVEKSLRNNIPAVNRIGSFFRDYKIIVFENDSTDGTKAVLREWQNSDPDHIHCIMEDLESGRTIPKTGSVKGNPFFSESRISKMSAYRNKYLEYIDNHSWGADYLMVVDLDVAKLFPDAVLSSFDTDIEWDAVTAYGYSTGPNLQRRYHDTYIFQEWEERDSVQTEAHMNVASMRYGRLKPGNPWIRVASAFGGLAIYRFEAIRGLRYKVIPNDDERVTVYGEHYSIYKQMMERGYDKFYLNPAMYLKYQRVSARIIWNSIMRKIGVK